MLKIILLILTLTFAVEAKTPESEAIALTVKNHCYLDGQVSSASMGAMKDCLATKHLKRGKLGYPIYLVINSPGGSVYAGLDFIRFARNIPNLKTYTIFAASMASAIVEHLPGRRYADRDAIYMFHRAKGSFSGQFEDGEVEKQLKLWKEIVRSMERRSSKRIGISLADYKARVKDEWWIVGKDNVIENVADEIRDVYCSNELLKRKKSKEIRTMFGAITISVSECPLIGRYK